jgi:hypothetical protein
MAHGRVGIFAEVTAHPGNAFAAHDVVGVNEVLKSGRSGYVTADDDVRIGRELAHHATHLADFAEVHDDGRNSDDVVVVGFQLAGEVFAGGKVEHRARRRNILLDDLVVVKLHGIDGATAKFVVLRVGTENRSKKHACAAALRMNLHFGHTPDDCDGSRLRRCGVEKQ